MSELQRLSLLKPSIKLRNFLFVKYILLGVLIYTKESVEGLSVDIMYKDALHWQV